MALVGLVLLGTAGLIKTGHVTLAGEVTVLAPDFLEGDFGEYRGATPLDMVREVIEALKALMQIKWLSGGKI